MDSPDSAVPFSGGSLEDKTLPPPPPEGNLEVIIRTLESDLKLLEKSGGALSYTSGGANMVMFGGHGKPAVTPAAEGSGAGRRTQMLIWGAVLIMGIVIFFLIGRYVIPKFLGGGAEGSGAQEGTAQTAAPGGGQKTAQPKRDTTPVFFGHAAFFRSQAPRMEIDLYARSAPPDRASFVKTIQDRAAGDAENDFWELTVRGVQGRTLTWGELTEFLGADALNQPVLENGFLRDYTAFAYRDKKGIWLGFIFKLKEGETPLLLQRDILAIETNTRAFESLYLVGPGAADAQFRDAQQSGQPVRVLAFRTPGISFTYGWFFNTYLMMSESDMGLKLAIENL